MLSPFPPQHCGLQIVLKLTVKVFHVGWEGRKAVMQGT